MRDPQLEQSRLGQFSVFGIDSMVREDARTAEKARQHDIEAAGIGWQEVAQTVAAYYHTLSPDEQNKTAIFANNYGDAGAIDFFGPRYVG